MASKRWSVAVTDLTGTARLHEIAVEADNWMSALRSGRTRIGEEGGVPQGASCAVSPDGVVTILDPVSRRKFVLSQRAATSDASAQPGPITTAPTTAAVSTAPASNAPVSAAVQPTAPIAVAEAGQPDPSTGKRKKFQTVAFDAGMALPIQPQAEPIRDKAKFQTVAFDASSLVKEPPQSTAATAAPVVRSVPPNPLAPVNVARTSSPPTNAAPTTALPAVAVAPAAALSSTVGSSDPGAKRKKFQTVAFDASTMGLQQPRAATPIAAPASATNTSQTAPTTAAVTTASTPHATVPSTPSAQPTAVAPTTTAARSNAPAPTFAARADVAPSMSTPTSPIQLLHERSEDPTPKNPLTYRERSFVVTGNVTPSNAEQMLRAALGKLQEELSQAKRGKFVNLALFDHAWQDRPQRPPVATLQWKDWKGDPEISFPAPQPAPVTSATPSAQDDRLATAFEALQDLPFLNSAAEGLEFTVKLLGDTIPSQAVAACLYDINTDELRVVAAAGTGSQERKTQAIPVAAGVFGQAARGGDRALTIADAQRHPDFDPGLDSAPGIQARNMLLRPLIQDGQLFGVLQLINRVGANGYSAEDVSLINYVSERVADFVRQVRLRGR